uniref:Major sperm protein n=1 Tax=Ditylenchus dipsaci TaxID=166011 RepID=A0A915DCT9_9BILA
MLVGEGGSRRSNSIPFRPQIKAPILGPQPHPQQEEMPPPDRTPPKPPSALSLPVVPQTPAAFAFSVEPNRAAFTTEGGVSKHMLMNHSQDRLAIKVRCSNNQYFRVNPVYSFLDCGAVSELEMIRLQGGLPRKDMLQLIFVVCRDNDADPSQLFTQKAKTRSLVLPLTTI